MAGDEGHGEGGAGLALLGLLVLMSGDWAGGTRGLGSALEGGKHR